VDTLAVPNPSEAVGIPDAPAAWFPVNSAVVGQTHTDHASIIVYGRSGAGKSHLGRQLLRDTDYGPGEILFAMAEDSSTVYGPGARVVRCRSIADCNTIVEGLIAARAAGKRLPKVLFTDSISGVMDYARQDVRKQADVRAGFGDMGYGVIDYMIRLRDELPIDCVTLVTTTENDPNLPPELSVEGKLVPKHLTRLSNIALYLKSEQVSYDPKAVQPLPALHRILVLSEDGQPAGKAVNRYFYTHDAGEVIAKGHHALLFRERAILPDVLRKIHAQ